MFSKEILDKIQGDLWQSMHAFVPELLLCAGIVFMLLLRLLPGLRMHMSGVAAFFAGVALLLSIGQWLELTGFSRGYNLLAVITNDKEQFAGTIVVDRFTVFMRILLLGFACLLIWLTYVSGIPDEEDSADFYTLLLGGTRTLK